MIVTKSLEDSIRDFENRMRREQQKQDDRTVFVDYDNPRIKTVENLYGDFVSRGEVPNKTVYKTEDRIVRFGFDTLTQAKRILDTHKVKTMHLHSNESCQGVYKDSHKSLYKYMPYWRELCSYGEEKGSNLILEVLEEIVENVAFLF